MNNTIFKRSLLAITIAAGLASVSTASIAGNVDGAIKGSVVAQASQESLAGATIIVSNKAKGYSKTITADADGQFNLAHIAVGKYLVTISKPGYQTSQVSDVIIGIGKTVIIDAPLIAGNIETIAVSGARISAIDFGSSESSFAITADELDVLPIARNLNAVALLAPGTVEGDSRFGGLVSFGGSSAAENTYYVNGLNMTDFRRGLGGATVPFTAYESFQIKTGGYSAEFGRSTGGVVSAVTKSGSNDFTFGIDVITTPQALRSQHANELYKQNDCTYGIESGVVVPDCDFLLGDVLTNRQNTESDATEINLSASGAIIEDTLFFYAAYRNRDFSTDSKDKLATTSYTFQDDDPYYLLRLDWNINEDHSLMAWGFSDKRTTQNSTTRPNGNVATGYAKSGGDSYSIRYTGNFTDSFSMSAMIGSVEFADTVRSSVDDTCPVIWDARGPGGIGCWANFRVSENNDTRSQFRVDFEYLLNDEHTFRFGLDVERNEAFNDTKLSGGTYYLYTSVAAGATLRNGHEITEATEVVRQRGYATGGTFKINNNAWYIEDQWDVTDTLRLNLGLRGDSFENLNANGNTFIEIKNQIAPRLGLAWDVAGDGDHKVFANFGRYFLPVAANTNVRLAGAETYYHEWFVLEGTNSDDTPIIGAMLGERHTTGTGIAPAPDSLVDHDIEPMYNDEFILGYQAKINDEWSWGVKFTNRTLGNQIDDGSVRAGLKTKGIDADHFILFNPGRPVKFNFDSDGDGVSEFYELSAKELGYPSAERKYHALDFSLERSWDGDWMFNAKYTWSQNYGNAEGYVKSDNGQDDAGLTTDWDYPYLMDGAYGNLPNDRRHVFKVFGAYTILDNWTVGTNLTIQSGRPWTALGNGYTPDSDLYEYGSTYWVGDRKFSRGSFGRTPWLVKFDLNSSYKIEFGESEMNFRVDIFNVFNADAPTRYVENAEVVVGQSNPNFGYAAARQAPRRVQLTMDYRF